MSSKKKELIEIVTDMLKTTAPEDIRIREIAYHAGCTSTVIYKHFENLDHLLALSSVAYLEDYITNVSRIIGMHLDGYHLLRELWVAFAECAFQNIDVFELLFFGKHRDELAPLLFEYYSFFPERNVLLSDLVTVLFFDNELIARNGLIVRKATMDGYFSLKEEKDFNHIQCNFFRGFLQEYKSSYRKSGVPEEALARFMKLIDSLMEHYCIKEH